MKRRTFLKGILGLPFISIPSIVLSKPESDFLYLEVSPRRSGKTTRLVNHMCEYIDRTGKYVYFMSGNYSMTYYIIRNYIPKKYHEYIKDIPLNLEELENLRYYYDEPDLIKDLVLNLNNAYYVGTPRGTTGALYKVYEYKKEYKKYASYTDLKHIREHVTEKTYNREVLGLWN